MSINREADGTVQIFDPVARYSTYGGVALLAVVTGLAASQIAGSIGIPAILVLAAVIGLLLCVLARRVTRVGVHLGPASVEIVGLSWPVRSVRVPRCEVIGLTSDNVAASWMVALEMRDGSRVRCPFVMPEPLMKIALFGDMRVKARAELAQELGFDSR